MGFNRNSLRRAFAGVVSRSLGGLMPSLSLAGLIAGGASVAAQGACDPGAGGSMVVFQQDAAGQVFAEPWACETWLHQLDSSVTGPGVYTGFSGTGVPLSLTVIDAHRVEAVGGFSGLDAVQSAWAVSHQFSMTALVGRLVGPGGTRDIIGTSYSVLDTAGVLRTFLIVQAPCSASLYALLRDGLPPIPPAPEVDPGDLLISQVIIYHSSVVSATSPISPIDCGGCQREFQDEMDAAVDALVAAINPAKIARDATIADAIATCIGTSRTARIQAENQMKNGLWVYGGVTVGCVFLVVGSPAAGYGCAVTATVVVAGATATTLSSYDTNRD